MHRAFRPGDNGWTSTGIERVRSLFQSLALVETEHEGGWQYHRRGSRGWRQVATLHGRGRSATVYLYPDALELPPGSATPLYLALDAAGLGMGSKAGPSIGIDLDDAGQLALFADGLRELFSRPSLPA